MTVKVTLEFDNVDNAIVALGYLAEANSPQSSTGTGPTVAKQAATEAASHLPKPPSKTVQSALDKHGLTAEQVGPGSGKNGALTKKDVEAYVAKQGDQGPATQPAKDLPGKTVDEYEGEVIPDLDTCKAKLKALNEVTNLQNCINTLGRFGVKRVSDLPAEKFGDFIATCDKIIAAGA